MMTDRPRRRFVVVPIGGARGVGRRGQMHGPSATEQRAIRDVSNVAHASSLNERLSELVVTDAADTSRVIWSHGVDPDPPSTLS